MRLIWFVFFTLLTDAINSCNLCWDYRIKDPRLQRETLEHDSQCTCPCWQYPHTEGTNNFYKCQVCDHRLTPPNPLSKKGPQYRRFYHKGDRNFKPTSYKYPSKSPETNPRPLMKIEKLNVSGSLTTMKKS